MAHRLNRWQHLLLEPDVRRWHNNLARGAVATADVYLRALGRFLDGAGGLTPTAFLEMEVKAREDLLNDFIDEQLAAGLAGSYVKVYKKAVTSWLAWNGQRLHRPIKIPGAHLAPTLRNASIPDQDAVRSILNAADARARTASALIAFGGCRLEVLGDHLGRDGLRLRDLEGVRVCDGDVVFERVPVRVVVPEALSKTGRPYFTFLGAEGCDYLRAYLRERLNRGEALGPGSPVITPKWAKKPFIRTTNISDLIRKPMRAAGVQEPPYILRSYFSSRAMLAESRGFLRDYKEFFMGHNGDIGHVYALHKQLPPDTIEAMRGAYSEGLAFFETRVGSVGAADPVREMVQVLLETAGVASSVVEGLDLDGLSHSELAQVLQEHAFKPEPAASSGVRQRTIRAEELDAALAEGWQFRFQLQDGRILVEGGG